MVGLRSHCSTCATPACAIPLGFLAVIIGSLLYRDRRADDMWDELYARQNTGILAAKAAAHQPASVSGDSGPPDRFDARVPAQARPVRSDDGGCVLVRHPADETRLFREGPRNSRAEARPGDALPYRPARRRRQSPRGSARGTGASDRSRRAAFRSVRCRRVVRRRRSITHWRTRSATSCHATTSSNCAGARRNRTLLHAGHHRDAAAIARRLSAHYVQRAAEQQSIARPLSGLVRREPVTCAGDAPLSDALTKMSDARVRTVVVVGRNNEPIGMFTLVDLLAWSCPASR